VPNRPPEQLRGVDICRQGRRRYQTVFDKRTDPRGGVYYWIGTGDPQDQPLPGTDLGAIADSRISICPVRLDLTDNAAVDGLREWLPAG
jgi:5'-nucleotidase